MDILRLLFSSLDSDLEFIATGCTVLLLLITGLDDELNRLIEGTVGQKTRAIAE